MQVVMRTMMSGVFLLMWMFVGHHMGSFLTMILEMWGVFVLIMVAMVDERMRLFEMIGRLSTDAVGMVWEGADAPCFDLGLAL